MFSEVYAEANQVMDWVDGDSYRFLEDVSRLDEKGDYVTLAIHDTILKRRENPFGDRLFLDSAILVDIDIILSIHTEFKEAVCAGQNRERLAAGGEFVADQVPGVSEIKDADTLFDSNQHWALRMSAGASLFLSLVTVGQSPSVKYVQKDALLLAMRLAWNGTRRTEREAPVGMPTS